MAGFDPETIPLDDARWSAGCYHTSRADGVERGGPDEHLSDQDPVGYGRFQRGRTRHPDRGGPGADVRLGATRDPRPGRRPECHALPRSYRPGGDRDAGSYPREGSRTELRATG